MFYAVYGAEVGDVYHLNEATVHPVFSNSSTLQDQLKLKVDQKPTAVIETRTYDDELFFDLKACLSFIDGAKIEIFGPLEATDRDTAVKETGDPKYANFLGSTQRNRLIRSDEFSTGARQRTLIALMEKLQDSTQAGHQEFRRLLHGAVFGIEKNFSDYVDVQYYMYFSTLEALAREIEGNRDSGAHVVLASFFNRFGLSLSAENDENLLMGCRTYSSLRNSLFHNGELEAVYRRSQAPHPPQTLKLTDYSSQFERLVRTAILRFAGLGEEDWNWDSWKNRMPL